MKEISFEELLAIFKHAKMDWYLHDPILRANRVKHVLNEFSVLSQELERYLKRPMNVLEEVRQSPESFIGLVQTITMPMTANTRAMVYCVSVGATVNSIQYKYVLSKQSSLNVNLTLGQHANLNFQSEELWDAEVLHHMGFAKLNGEPFVHGYFAFGEL